MTYIPFGKAQVSQIMLGTMRIARLDAAAVSGLLASALDAGINAVDTADIYGGGACEELLGRAFAADPSLRGKVFLQTKCGIRIDPDFTWFDFSKEHILEAVDASLARLHTDHVDSLLLHRPDALMEPDEIAEAFDRLRQQGKVLDFGVSNMNPAMLELVGRAFPVAANQVQLSCAFTPAFNAGFNVNMENDAAIMRDGGIFEYCRLHGIAIQAWSALQYGYFGGAFIGSPEYPELNAVLGRLAAEKGAAPAAIALAWILRYPARIQAVIGTTSAAHVREAAQAADVALSKKEWYEVYLSAGNRLP